MGPKHSISSLDKAGLKIQFLESLSFDPKGLLVQCDNAVLPLICIMNQSQTCTHIGYALQPTTDSWISSNDFDEFVNGEVDFAMESSTSSDDVLTKAHHDLHHIQGTNQSNGGEHLVQFQEVQFNPSIPSNGIIGGQNMDSMVEAPFWEQLLVREQLSPSSHAKSAIQPNDRSRGVHAAVGPRQPVDRDLPIPNQPPTTENWRVYRSIFTRLYKAENKTLREVMNIMKEQYHFRAR